MSTSDEMSDMDEILSGPIANPARPLDFLRLYLTGFAMGAADIVPGVSGGTMAFILGIYEELVNGIKAFNFRVAGLALRFRLKEALEAVPWKFMLALGAGVLSAIVVLSGLLSSLLENHPTFLFAFFGGLILASIVAIGAKIRWDFRTFIALLGGACFAFYIVGLTPAEGASHSSLFLFGSGMIAICAMILPGISGSFILLILGQYKYILEAVHERDLVTVFTVAAGCGVGILLFARVLSWLLARYHAATVAVLTGFMLGSLRVIWTSAVAGLGKVPEFGSIQLVQLSLLVVAGFLIVSILDHLESKDNPLLRIVSRRRNPVVA